MDRKYSMLVPKWAEPLAARLATVLGQHQMDPSCRPQQATIELVAIRVLVHSSAFHRTCLLHFDYYLLPGAEPLAMKVVA